MFAPRFSPAPWFIAAVLMVSSVHAAEPVDIVVAPDCRIAVIRLSAGSYDQGSPDTEPGRKDDETRRHVTLTKPVDLARTPVTRAQFAAFVAATGYRTEAEKGKSGGFGLENGEFKQARQYTWKNPGFTQTGDHPVVIVTHDDANAFCRWVGSRTGRVCRLPTEAEWEYACRSGSETARYSSAGADAIARHRGNADKPGTAPVGGLAANAWGFTDMAGHVREWCADWYAPRDSDAATDPFVASAPSGDKARRVHRGASFLQGPEATRSSARGRSAPGSRNADTGFRVLLEVAPAQAAAVEVTRDAAPAETAPGGSSPGYSASSPVSVDSSQFSSFRHSSPSFRVSRSSSFSIFSMIPLFILGGAVVVVIFILKKVFTGDSYDTRYRRDPGSRPGGFGTSMNPFETAVPPPLPSGVTLAPEGFWLAARLAPLGSLIHYRWRRGSNWTDGVTRFTPGSRTGGQFIYTGAAPEAVEILGITPDTSYDNGTFDTPPDFPDNTSDDSFTRGAAAGWMGHRILSNHRTSDDSLSRSSVFSGRPSAY